MKKRFYLICCLTAMLYGCSLDEVIDVGDFCPPNVFVDDNGYIVNRTGAYSNAIGEKLADGQKKLKVVNRIIVDEDGYLVNKEGKRVDNVVSFSTNLANYKTYKGDAILEYMFLSYSDAKKYQVSDNTQKCSIENGCMAQNFAAYLQKGRCPDDYPACAMDENGAYFCMVGSDNPAKIVCDGEWINPRTDNQYCGASGTCLGEYRGSVCKSNETCDDGKCVRTSSALCEDNEHLYNEECEPDTVENCGLHDKNCLKNSGWLTGECIAKQCVATACNEAEGYALDGTQCISSCLPGEVKCDGACRNPMVDPNYCGATGTPLSCDERGFICEDGYSCVEGRCAINCPGNLTACSTAAESYCTDITKDVNNCTECGKVCATEDFPNSVSLFCDKGCVIESCEEGYHIYNNSCEPNTVDDCGSHGYSCKEHNPGWKTGICTADGFCEASACSAEAGYHLSEIRCVADTRECCGENCMTCNSVELCSNGVCSTSCKAPLLMCISEDLAYCANVTVDLDNCGACGEKCTIEKIENASEVYCDSGCKASACKPGYHIYDNKCEKDDLTNCGRHDAGCNVDNADNMCENGICSYACKVDYHSKDDTCEEDSVDNCGSHGYICAAVMPGWKEGTCTDKKCKATACIAGYHLDAGQCAADTNTACGDNKVNCGKAAVCSNGVCSTTCTNPMSSCGSGQNSYCANLSNDNSNCGKCGVVCAVENASNSYCNAGACRASVCKQGYHVYNGACEINSDANCGSHSRVCNVTNATNKCNTETGQCTYTCNTGYHAYNGSCEANGTSNCGSHDNVCSKNNAKNSCDATGQCTFVCNTGYHIYDDGTSLSCEADSTSNCGAHGNSCATLDGWNGGSCSSGKCTATSCKPGYCLSNGVCKDGSGDADACGISGGTTKCAVCDSEHYCSVGVCASKLYPPNVCETAGENTYASCGKNCANCQTQLTNSTDGICTSSGQCYATACKSGYHVYDGRCEVDSATNCGYHGYTCQVGMFTGAKSVKCASSVCAPASCNANSAASYHLYNGECERDSLENCAGHGITCSTDDVSHATKVNCWFSKCQASACEKGYILSGSSSYGAYCW